MKLLVVSNPYPPHSLGGCEERCRQIVERLRDRGHDVTVLTSNHETGDAPEAPDPKVLRQLRMHGDDGQAPIPIRKLFAIEKKNQVTLREVLQTIDPEVVHVWNMAGLGKSLLHTLETCKRPLVYDISNHWMAHGLREDAWLSWWNGPAPGTVRALRKLAGVSGFRRRIDRSVPTAPISRLKFRRIYFCSRSLREQTVRQGYPVGHGDVIHFGVEVDAFARKVDFRPPRRFLWVGRLTREKDPMTALKGFLRVREATGQPLELDYYGSGDPDLEDQLRHAIAAAGADSFVSLRSVPKSEMASLYADYDAFIFSSNWGEPFALAPLEAMAAGLPVIMCPDGGNAELVDDGVNALKFAPGSTSSLAGAIEHLLRLPDHGEKLSRIARREVEQRFALDIVTDKIEAALQHATHGY